MARKNGGTLPKILEEAPVMLPGLHIYFEAFMCLHTTRPLGFGAQGWIPWTCLHQWCLANDISEPEEIDRFWRILHSLDRAYLDHVHKKQEKK